MIQYDIEKYSSITPLYELGKDLNIKYEILNMKQLENLREYGCKILVLSSCIHDYGNELCVEESNGTINKFTSDQLYTILKPQFKEINIEVVFICSNNGVMLAEVFKKLKVPQVFTFQLDEINNYKSSI